MPDMYYELPDAPLAGDDFAFPPPSEDLKSFLDPTKCQHCGAPLDFTEEGLCTYCNGLLDDWNLSDPSPLP
jgi:hypothetical protein